MKNIKSEKFWKLKPMNRDLGEKTDMILAGLEFKYKLLELGREPLAKKYGIYWEPYVQAYFKELRDIIKRIDSEKYKRREKSKVDYCPVQR